MKRHMGMTALLLALVLLFENSAASGADAAFASADASVGVNAAGTEKKSEKDLTEEPLKGSMTGTIAVENSSGISYLQYEAKMDSCVLFGADEKTETARIYYTSYRIQGGTRERPVTFVFNGGPGSASLFLQMGMFGPRGVTVGDKGLTIPATPYAVTDNPDCVLDVTDLVFVDPVGTGFSRASLKPAESGKGEGTRDTKPFWGVEEDLNSLAEFVRVWLSQNRRWGAPVVLCGESYGGLRVAGLAAYLIDGENIVPDGIVLISPALSYAELIGDSYNRNPALHSMPVAASTALYHGKLGREFEGTSPFEYRERVRQWAEEVYAPALLKGRLLPPEQEDAVAAELSRFTGIPKPDILRRSLLVDVDLFVDRVLGYDGVFVSGYDTRLTAPDAPGRGWGEDPSNVVTGPSFVTAWRRYLEEELGVETDREYVLLSYEANGAWNFASGREARRFGYPGTVHNLSSAMRRFPDMKLLVASGLYDAVTPAESVLYSLSRLEIPRDRLERNMILKIYEGGHMFYTNSEERRRFADDFRSFMQKPE